jgi:nitrogen fixation NifU-like protein
MTSQKRIVRNHPILDHFYNPRNALELSAYSVEGQASDPQEGVQTCLRLQIEDQRIVAISFRTRGCMTSVACASMLTELVNGQQLEYAWHLEPETIATALGGVPPGKRYCCEIAIGALRNALAAWSATTPSAITAQSRSSSAPIP